MAGPPAAYNGTDTTHGGTVTAAGTVYVNQIPIAHVGDSVSCHNGATVDTGSGTVFADKKPVARLGDETSCSATLVAPVAQDVLVG